MAIPDAIRQLEVSRSTQAVDALVGIGSGPSKDRDDLVSTKQ
jgi:hypothetical protein